MKPAPAFLLGALIVLVLGAGQPEPSGAPGRFAIIAGTVHSLAYLEGRAIETPRAITFKLDTMTGESWQWVDVNIAGQITQGWKRCVTLENPTTTPATSR